MWPFSFCGHCSDISHQILLCIQCLAWYRVFPGDMNVLEAEAASCAKTAGSWLRVDGGAGDADCYILLESGQ
ncbi:hypothetical protein BCR34DRAFT_2153 [Clohesyomyces aquaticus]|uniref:Uncharacterized protein n=1 Tax=Clohesyomyces aquaticus TaxID=1231657 RepID=A0A1Y2AB08_9PLEO|nr:hypothetical protein BCR34DRAFT_2153 [Clohesyomyces aquaticus]